RRPPRSAHFPYTTLFRSLVEPLEEELEVLVRFPRKADDERRAQHEVGNGRAPLADPLERSCLCGGPPHRFQDPRARVLERNVEVDRKSTRLNSSHVKISY